MKRTDSKFMRALERLDRDKQPIQVQMSKIQCFCTLTAIQLACRHPHFDGPARRIVEDLARQIGGMLVANDPDLKMLFEMGWDKQFDTKVEEGE